ncbi:MAG: S9 family peptidase [Bacteroidia bacterium]|nr:S9 family peptidase [Bacteroidia bacterium]MCF8426845.1 S9 family peptidase [Bacteroidia bacterium]MCF8447536.1 S9 family peptidase [Bacteroidia bacterium]
MKSDIKMLFGGFVLFFVIGACSPKKENGNAVAPVIAMENFFRNPENAYFILSPSGEQIAFTKPVNSRMNIFATQIGSNDTVQLTALEDRDISGYFWKSDSLIVYIRDNGGDENYHLFSVNVGTQKQADLTPFPKVSVQIVDALVDKPNEILVGMNKENPELFDVYHLNIETGELKMEAKNPGGVINWITDHDGTIRVAVQSDGVNQVLLYRPNIETPFKQVLRTSFKETVTPLFFTFDNKYIYAASNLNRDKSAIVKFDIANGKELEVLFSHPDVDVSDLSYSKKRKVLTEIDYITDKTEMKFLDKETENLYQKLASKLGTKYEIIITSSNLSEDKILVRTISDRSLGASYFYDIKKDELTKITDRGPWLDENQMCEMKPISYVSLDGNTIHGYLTLPKGSSGKNLPVIINPHGGPWYRDEWGWNPEVQFLANRGYAVLQMNFRGSTGYGRKFWELGFKQWGNTMQQDITDGVNWLIKEGIADPKKVGIYGASYGGYATLAGVTFTPNVYACGVDYVGVSNLFTFMATVPPYWKPFMKMMYEMVGDPKQDSILLRESSPLFSVDKIKVPLFIAQGANDPRVNKSESDQIVEALKKRGVKVEYMVKDNEGHGFRNEENQFDFYGSMEKFLAAHLGGRIYVKEKRP